MQNSFNFPPDSPPGMLIIQLEKFSRIQDTQQDTGIPLGRWELNIKECRTELMESISRVKLQLITGQLWVFFSILVPI